MCDRLRCEREALQNCGKGPVSGCSLTLAPLTVECPKAIKGPPAVGLPSTLDATAEQVDASGSDPRKAGGLQVVL